MQKVFNSKSEAIEALAIEIMDLNLGVELLNDGTLINLPTDEDDADELNNLVEEYCYMEDGEEMYLFVCCDKVIGQ